MESSTVELNSEQTAQTPQLVAVRKQAELLPSELQMKDIRSKKPPLLSFLLRAENLRRLGRVISLLLVDFIALFAAVFTALGVKATVRYDFDFVAALEGTEKMIPFVYLITVLLFLSSDLYSRREVRPGMTKIVASLFSVMVVSLIFSVVNGDTFSSYYIFYSSLVFAVIYVTATRTLYERITGVILRSAGYDRKALIVGSGDQIRDVAHALKAQPHSSIHPIGFVSLTPLPDNGIKSLGTLENLPEILNENKVDEVIITDPNFPQPRALELIEQCHRRGVAVRVAPSTMEILIHRAEFVPGQSVPLFELKPPVFEGIDFVLKRTFDLVVSILLLVAMSPFLLLIALAVKLTSSGPVIYRSRRPGIGGEPFDCLKFRTMQEGAEDIQEVLEGDNEASGPLFKIKEDPRITRVGRVLRRFSLDELLQLVNVVKGEMSLVGPRPLPQRDFDQLDEWHKKRYLVLPGITGLWQVSGRSELDFDDLVRLDFLYLERWSIFLDLVVLLKTVPAVFTRRGAY